MFVKGILLSIFLSLLFGNCFDEVGCKPPIVSMGLGSYEFAIRDGRSELVIKAAIW